MKSDEYAKNMLGSMRWADQTNIDISNIPDMRCVCGNDVFIQVFRLKFLSPVSCGDPAGGTFSLPAYKCINPDCGLEFNTALSQAEIDRLRDKVQEKYKPVKISRKSGKGD